jgi:hypothetical protein
LRTQQFPRGGRKTSFIDRGDEGTKLIEGTPSSMNHLKSYRLHPEHLVIVNFGVSVDRQDVAETLPFLNCICLTGIWSSGAVLTLMPGNSIGSSRSLIE